MMVGGAYVPLGAAINAWSNIRFEHYYEQSLLKVYVNNELVYEIATASAGSADTATIYLTSNERNTGSNADLYIDNVYSGYVTIE